jgi:hypothetical protein
MKDFHLLGLIWYTNAPAGGSPVVSISSLIFYTPHRMQSSKSMSICHRIERSGFAGHRQKFHRSRVFVLGCGQRSGLSGSFDLFVEVN